MPLTEEEKKERRLKKKRAARHERLKDPAYREAMRVKSQSRRDCRTDAQKDQDREYFSKYRQKNKARKQQVEKAYYQATKEARKKYVREYYRDNLDKIKAYEKIRRSKTAESRQRYAEEYRGDPINREKKKALLKSQKDNLEDVYIKGILAKSSNLSSKEIPQSLVNVKRTYIKGMRLIKEQEDEGQKD